MRVRGELTSVLVTTWAWSLRGASSVPRAAEKGRWRGQERSGPYAPRAPPLGLANAPQNQAAPDPDRKGRGRWPRAPGAFTGPQISRRSRPQSPLFVCCRGLNPGPVRLGRQALHTPPAEPLPSSRKPGRGVAAAGGPHGVAAAGVPLVTDHGVRAEPGVLGRLQPCWGSPPTRGLVSRAQSGGPGAVGAGGRRAGEEPVGSHPSGTRVAKERGA